MHHLFIANSDSVLNKWTMTSGFWTPRTPCPPAACPPRSRGRWGRWRRSRGAAPSWSPRTRPRYSGRSPAGGVNGISRKLYNVRIHYLEEANLRNFDDSSAALLLLLPGHHVQRRRRDLWVIFLGLDTNQTHDRKTLHIMWLDIYDCLSDTLKNAFHGHHQSKFETLMVFLCAPGRQRSRKRWWRSSGQFSSW